jgi:hypothetical protein
MKRLLLILTVFLPVLSAQSVTIISPTANQALTGYSGFSFQVTLTSAPTTARVCFTVDAYPAPGLASSCALSAPWSLAWNTFWTLNGPHQVVAKAYDATGTVVATSAAVAFTVANTWPCPGAPSMRVTTGTPLTSNWSGSVSVGGTVSGAGAGSENFQWNWFVDGMPQGPNLIDTTATHSRSLDTTQFPDGPHVVGLVTQNRGSSCTSFSTGYEGAATEWTRTVNFSNGATVSELRNGAHEVFLAPAGTYTFTPTLLNANGTTVSSPKFDFQSQNTAVATVGSSNGSTSIVTAVANGVAKVYVMAETVRGADLTTVGPASNGSFSSSVHPFTYRNIGELLKITTTGGGSCTVGLYYINHVDSKGVANVNSPSPCSSSTSTAHFAVGPTRTTWVFVASSNILPHFGKDGSILTAYDSSKSLFINEMFGSTDGFGDQPYDTPDTNGSHLGIGADLNASGFNTLEMGVTNQDFSQSSQSAFQSGQTAYINSYLAMIATWPKFRLFGTADDMTTGQHYNSTRGPGVNFSPPAVQYVFQSLKNAGRFVGVSWQDEINNPWGPNPLQGPIQFVNSPTTQSGLTSIVSNGSTCTVHWTAWSMGGSGKFIIHGATTAGFNNAVGTSYRYTNDNANQFHYSCSVTSGTYNSSTDPGLTIEPLFYEWGSGDYAMHYDGWEKLMGWHDAVRGAPPVTGSNAAGTTLASTANWSGNGTQSIGLVTQMGNWADLYWSHSRENYIVGRVSSFALIDDTNEIEEGAWTRLRYGSFNPSLPITILTDGTSANYNFGSNDQVSISSITNEVITFSSPHDVPVVIPGVSRLWINGTGNSAYNTNFYINGILSPTQLSVSLAAEDFSGTSTGGTITFQDGSTKANSTVTATTTIQPDGDTITYGGSPDPNISRHRGQTFTLSGTSGGPASTFNSRRFYMVGTNLMGDRDSNGSTVSFFFFRELPTGSSTGGTAAILTDNNFIRGRNPSQVIQDGNYSSPGFGFDTVIEAAILRAAGQRMYKIATTTQGYSDHAFTLRNGVLIKGGWLGPLSRGNVTQFRDNSFPQYQVFAHPHWETGYSVPMFHAINQATLLVSANQKYILQPAMSSPDYGLSIDCGARSGANGAILMCLNATDSPETRTFDLSPYLQSGQQIARYSAGPLHIRMTVLAAGTRSDTFTLNANETVFYVFPASFAGDITMPTLAPKVSDVTNATQFGIRFGYDRYTLDLSTSNVQLCSASPCQLLQNRFGPIYYRIIYLDSTGKTLATTEVQTI